MSVHQVDAVGMKCPMPALKALEVATKLQPGDVLEVHGDCSTFEKDMREMFGRMKKIITSVQDLGSGRLAIQVQW